MAIETIKPHRPSSITLISIFLIYSGLMSFYYIFRGALTLSTVDTLFFAFGGIVFIICGIGFWLMKKWAVYAYAIFAVINQVALFLLGRWNIFSLLLLGIIVYVGYRHLSKMS